MNAKRWSAIGVALGIFIFSLFFSNYFSYIVEEQEATESLSDNLLGFLGTTVLEESLLEAGDTSKRIVLLSVDGTILDGQTSGFTGDSVYDHDLFLQQLEQVLVDDTIKAIVLSVNTPGGGTYESAQIKDKLVEIQETTEKPIYVSMGSMAASGGYYISASAEKIFASEETLTGSIGVIMSGTNFSELFEKIGVDDTTIKSGEFKDIGSSTRTMTEEDAEILQTMVNTSYDRFVDVIVEGRGMDEAVVRTIADGRIYDGAQAVSNGLVDEIGYQEDALEAIKKDYDLEDAEIFTYQGPAMSFSSLFSSKVSSLFQSGESMNSDIDKLMTAIGTPDSPKMMYYYGGE
ncbi:putative signal peptide peptidase SppA [Carnobacterium sp. 17-4]|uniref:signal peptide peptidase SppA n=1 Tax=Carnobacterium sp. (strain 17-4) TaxID=208596 RepID=UPI0002059329|nr:signal peptide peptidase SppA [Carnobacterium sp. 17-4]AEB29836.1 putative signal peptide peptidase SppA [Carnobacterium sp. 17-4]